MAKVRVPARGERDEGETPSLQEMLRRCRSAGLRATPRLKFVLKFLLEREAPVRVQGILSEPGLNDCDPATIYRLFARLEECGLVRQVGLRGRSAWFGLADFLRHRHYLCCRVCGSVVPLYEGCALAETEEKVARESGYTDLTHELTYYGVCPSCGG